MRLSIGSTIRVSDPTPEIVQLCKNTLTIKNPIYAKKARMGFWIGDTPKNLTLYEKDGDDLILPYGTRGVFSDMVVDGESLSLDVEFRCNKDIDFGGKPVPLYDYQSEAVDKLIESRYGILQSKAGSGKTQMGIALAKRYRRPVLWLTHTLDLLNQSKARAEQYIDKELIGTITGGKVEIGKGITFATVQTMAKLDLDRYKDCWDVVIVDECHRVAGSPTTMTQFYKVLNHIAARHKFGLSATVYRADGMIEATYALLGHVAYTVPDEAVAEKTMPVTVCTVDTTSGISLDCLNSDGTIAYAKMINHLCADSTRNDTIVRTISVYRDRPGLILSERLEHLRTLMSALPPEMREQSVMISGKMTSKRGKAEREQAIEDMRNGKKKYLFATFSLAKEGLDIPCLEVLYMTLPQKDYAVVTQAIGRVARTHEGKKDPICIDFVDNGRYFQRAFKSRVGIYRKNGCLFADGGAQ